MLNKRYVSTLMIVAIALVAAIGLSVYSASAQGPGTGNGTPMPCDGTGMGMMNGNGMMNGGGMGMMNGGRHSMGHHGQMAGMMNSEDCPVAQMTETSGTWWGWMDHAQMHVHNPEDCPYYQAMIADE